MNGAGSLKQALTTLCSLPADMEEVHVVMVLPSWEALGRMKADEVDLAPDDDDAEGVCECTCTENSSVGCASKMSRPPGAAAGLCGSPFWHCDTHYHLHPCGVQLPTARLLLEHQ